MSASLTFSYITGFCSAATLAAVVIWYLLRRARSLSVEHARTVAEARQSVEELLRFRTAFDMPDDGILLVDRESMRFVDVNAAATRNIGFSRDELLNMGPQDVLRIDRSKLGGLRTPIVALTAHAMKGVDRRCLEAGMDDYLSKPINKEALQACLDRWLQDAPASQDSNQLAASSHASQAV